MTEADLGPVLALEQAMFPLDAWSESTMRGELDDRSRTRHYVVAELDGEIVGYAGLAAVADQADVQTIAVRTDRQGMGIGRALFGELLDEAARRGVKEVFLEVRADNARARDLYTRFGFEKIGLRRRYYDDGVDAIVMRRDTGP
ncbi:ribosomal protein S18-alanine N-acetyltransferase [Rhizohabitans arisaemae]|uniref:ribosomal protein S18-alanine N-acetyltransferase n=1 Tax=Rhizohabitans arisaemae TaxID=2720610 RepID=UPI0024B1B766|nr:ribosomal protein S18-alanine N-acetyltransferase [Rhizohabitans arisaemae]